MRRFNLRGRIRRCRGSSSTGESTRTGAASRQLEAYLAPEVCEVFFDPGISARLRAHVLNQGDLFCRMCGVAPGDIDDLTGNRVSFHIRLITEKQCGVKEEPPNLQTLCTTCEEGSKNITTVKPPAIWLLSQIRRAGQEEQRAVLDWLLKKFKE